jgi:metallo-beta-lactamase family protein
MPLQLKFHGALTTVTGSCHFFKVKKSGNIYAVDCGATQGSDDEEQLAAPRNLPIDCRPDKLSGIILTHAHGDHISHLPRWFQAGFKGQIFCTKETAKLAEIALKDSKRIESDNKRWDVDEKAFEQTLDGLKSAKHVQPGEAELLEHEVTIEGAQTSHLLGCCAYRIKARDGEKTSSVLYTGDIGPIEHDDETQSLYAERQRHDSPSDYIVSESTYGDRPRSKESQSGRRRQARMCEVLSKSFRHGDESVVIIPAFSLQRSLDVLTDVFCALQYQRAEVGITKSCIPLIIIKSPLSWDIAQVYRDFFFDEVTHGHVFFNKHSLLQKTVRDSGDDEIGVLDSLVPHNDRENGFDGHEVVVRLDEADEKIQTEIAWGRGANMDGRPTVIICGSGMTHTGPIVNLMEEYLEQEFATFVLCGFVPPKSPGFQLRHLWPMSRVERASQSIKLPKDKATGRPGRVILGDEVKCGFESVSEFYSGHADGASINRYILGDKLERTPRTKGIFLVHGERAAREGLRDLLAKSCADAGSQAPTVYCPEPNSPWFDCETGQFEKGPRTMSVSPEGDILAIPNGWLDAVESAHSVADTGGLPEVIEVETCVIISNPGEPGDILEQMLGAFDFARPEMRNDDLLLKFGRPGSTHSTVLLQASKLGENLLKVTAQTRIKQAGHLADIANVAFDWRRLLNLLGVPRELYYAGVRWCQTDSEIDRLLAICAPCVYGTKQRRQPVLLLHADTLSGDEVQSLERLFTPAIVVAVLQEQSIAKINSSLGLEGERALGRNNPIYLPIKFNAGASTVFSEAKGVDIGRLSDLVVNDTFILHAREPQILSSGKPSPFTLPLAETTTPTSPKLPALRKPTPQRAPLKTLPYDVFTRIVVGQKLEGEVDYVRFKKDGISPSFAIVRVETLGISGMLHCTQMSPSFSTLDGVSMEVVVRQVDADRRKVYFTQHPVRVPTADFLIGIDRGGVSTASDISILLGKKVPADIVANAAWISLQEQGKPFEAVHALTQLDRDTLIDTYNRIVQEFSLIDTLSVSAPEPIKGPSYGDIARELGFNLTDVVNAAGHMIGDPSTYQLGVAVLPAGFTPTENSPFPAEHKHSFIRECRERAGKNWSKELDIESALKPDCLSLASLAMSMGITQAELLSLMSEKGIQPKVQVVLTSQDIKALRT